MDFRLFKHFYQFVPIFYPKQNFIYQDQHYCICHLLRELLDQLPILNTIEYLAKSRVFENIWNFQKNKHICEISQNIPKKSKKWYNSKAIKIFEIMVAACSIVIKSFAKMSWHFFSTFFPENKFFYTFLFYFFMFIVWLNRL